MFISLCISQEAYTSYIKHANSLYSSKKYSESGKMFLNAFKTLSPSASFDERITIHHFNAACSFALAKENDSAFKVLNIMVDKGKYANVSQISNDKDLISLHADKRWNPLIQQIKANYEKIKPLSKEALKEVFSSYLNAQANVYKAGSSVADADHLFSFYTDDFTYNHPGYGGTYSSESLYKNTVYYIKNGGYNKAKKRVTLKTIYGLNAVAVEQQYEGSAKTTMTLYKFRKNKIYYVHEFW